MIPHKILPQASADLDEAVTWYETQQQGLGLELLQEYREHLNRALATPRIGSPAGTTAAGSSIRRHRLKRFGRYAIIIANIQDDPTVLAFEHSSRTPKYWDQRVE